MKPPRIHPVHGLRTNARDLVMISVAGQVASTNRKGYAMRIGYDAGRARCRAPAASCSTIALATPASGWPANHVEPAVSIRNEARSAGGSPDAATRRCKAIPVSATTPSSTTGRAAGARGVVTGKHGGVDTVLIDFPLPADAADGNRRSHPGLGLRTLACA